MTHSIRFDNGATYERFMGQWSELVGGRFLEWAGAEQGMRWLDVGCGNGAFTELIVARMAPTSVHGIDPSPEQLAFARTRAALAQVDWRPGDAMALPFDDNTFDAAVMPLVIHFIPEPGVGVAEMRRVVRRGGLVAAYVWDMEGGGFPYENLHIEMRAREMLVPGSPRDDASTLAGLRTLWSEAGFEHIETTPITVSRTFASFEEYWTIVRGGPVVGRTLRELPADGAAALSKRMQELLPVDDAGRITVAATANAVRGIVR